MRWAVYLFFAISVCAAEQPVGSAIYQSHCAQCHDAPEATRIPSKANLQRMTPSMIMTALTTGVMKQQGASLSDPEQQSVAKFLGVAVAASIPVSRLENGCPAKEMEPSGFQGRWTSWGAGEQNQRFQTAKEAGLSVADVPKLKLKWAFGIPNVTLMRSQPVVANGRIYLAGDNGMVYSLNASSGCEYWATSTKQVRSGLVMGNAGSAPAIFFGNVSGDVTALDATSGALLWQVHVGDHPNALVTGTPAYANGRLYVPVSSYEELAAVFPGYECCTFRGSVVALNAQDGKQMWRLHTIPDQARFQRTSNDGRKIHGPSGAAVWASPTLDLSKQRLYFATGDNYSDPPTETSDALFAADLNTGQLIWSKQFTQKDTYNMSCGEPGKGNCPASPGQDLDFGSSPVLVTLPAGRRELILAQKSGMVYAVDPDASGALLWKARAGEGGALGGIQWGPAIDGQKIYAAVSDVRFAKSETPGKLSLDPAKGGGLRAFRITDGELAWSTPASGCKERKPCSPAQSSAVTAIPGAVFSGSLDGHLRAYDTAAGKLLWDFDTVQDFKTVNSVPAKGGSLDVAGPVIVGGMVFANSGYPQYGGLPGNVFLAFSLD
jgi:polyvinyl alcohol dehydrogenase (cytochrome)